MPRSRTLAAVVTFIVSSACGGGATSADGSALQDALTRTLAADGFHIEGTTEAEGEDYHAEGDYVAPDRLVMESSDATQSSKTIIVGKNHYSSEPGTPERFLLVEMPCTVSVDTFIPALSMVRAATEIQQTDGAFTFRGAGNEGTPIEGEARIENGYLVELSVEYPLPDLQERVHERWSFSDFGATVRIEPPSADQLVHSDNDPSTIVVPASPASCPS
jgi:hypothetical protein